eukprot:3607204-Rhodomonas_salina.1
MGVVLEDDGGRSPVKLNPPGLRVEGGGKREEGRGLRGEGLRVRVERIGVRRVGFGGEGSQVRGLGFGLGAGFGLRVQGSGCRVTGFRANG